MSEMLITAKFRYEPSTIPKLGEFWVLCWCCAWISRPRDTMHTDGLPMCIKCIGHDNCEMKGVIQKRKEDNMKSSEKAIKQPNLFAFAQEYCMINSVDLTPFWWNIASDRIGERTVLIAISREMGKTLFNQIVAEYGKYHVEPFVTFYTMGFLSKWGFRNGDALDYVDALDDWVEYNWDYHDPEDTNNEMQNRFFLAYLLIKYVCPLIEDAQFALIGTHHNPVRINTYKGQDIDHYGNEDYSDTLVKPEEVQVSVEMIKRDFLTFYQPNKNIWSEMLEQIGKLNSRNEVKV